MSSPEADERPSTPEDPDLADDMVLLDSAEALRPLPLEDNAKVDAEDDEGGATRRFDSPRPPARRPRGARPARRPRGRPPGRPRRARPRRPTARLRPAAVLPDEPTAPAAPAPQSAPSAAPPSGPAEEPSFADSAPVQDASTQRAGADDDALFADASPGFADAAPGSEGGESGEADGGDDDALFADASPDHVEASAQETADAGDVGEEEGSLFADAMPGAGLAPLPKAPDVSSQSKALKAVLAEGTLWGARSEEERRQGEELLRGAVSPPLPNDPFLGKDLGPFRVEGFLEIDRGERRYQALHVESEQLVLLRVFPLTGSYEAEFKSLAQRAEAVCRVQDPHLASAVASGKTADAFYVGFLPPQGPNLAQLFDQGAMPPEEVQLMLKQVGQALRPLHSRESVHGHLSPLTIRRERPGHYAVWEAGLARGRPAFSFLASGGEVLGFPGYIAPETVDSSACTPSSDLYSLGCVAWTVLAGHAPFLGDDEVQVLLDQLNQRVPELSKAAPDLPRDLAIVVHKLCGYTTDARYRSLHEFQQDLRALDEGKAVKPLADALEDAKSSTPVKVQDPLLSPQRILFGLVILNGVILLLLLKLGMELRGFQPPDPTETFEFALPEADGASSTDEKDEDS